MTTMQPVYLYTSDFDREVQWRSNFSRGIPVLLGLLQLILTCAIIGLEIASVVISPIYGTLYAGFWTSAIFTLSWLSLLGLICCHRARKWATYMFFVSLLCAAAAITLIVLDALFIGNISRCFFSKVICDDLQANNRASTQPLGRKVQLLKAQMACAAALVATALLYILIYLSAVLSSRRGRSRVLIEHRQVVPQYVRRTVREQSPPAWKTATVPITYEPSELDCPQCGTSIKLSEKKRYVQVNG